MKFLDKTAGAALDWCENHFDVVGIVFVACTILGIYAQLAQG